MLEQIIEILTILLALTPILVQVFNLLTQKTSNQRLINLSERATIVVTALEQTNLTNDLKKQEAFRKLATYAQEVGIKVTHDQLDDYIESAVKFMKLLNQPEE